MQTRSGPFWDGVQGRAPIPPAAATLAFEFVDADVAAARVIALSGAPAAA
jgi:hypothetical protein